MSSRPILAGLFVVAGALHFVLTPVYVSIIPAYLPEPTLLVQISGAAEMLGGVGLLVPLTKQPAAWGLVLLLVCVMPANLNMAIHAGRWPSLPAWLLWVRLPLQVPLIWWAWLSAKRTAS